MKVINMLLVLVVSALFTGYSEAAVVWATYDEVKDETTVQYKVEKGDVLWRIYKEMISEKVTMDLVKKDLMHPNNITNPKKIDIGTVLIVKIKGRNISSGNFKNEKSASVESVEKKEILSNISKTYALDKEDVSLAFANNSKNQRMVSLDIVESGVPVMTTVSKDSAESDLVDSLKAAEEEIVRLKEAIAIKDTQISSLTNERDKLINNKVFKAGLEKEHPRKVVNNQEKVEDYSEKIALKSYYKKRTLWVSCTLFTILVLSALLAYWYFKSNREKYDPKKERRLATVG